jgi:hypothetical protein
MPGFDRTGPAGAGPMTGRGLGPCGGGMGYGRGLGRGYGRGLGTGRFAWGPYQNQKNPVNEKAVLVNDAKVLQKELDAVKKRLEEIEEQK